MEKRSTVVSAEFFQYMHEKDGITFDCSISRVFSVIRGFLSSGGGGLIRFFYDQINKIVKYIQKDVCRFVNSYKKMCNDLLILTKNVCRFVISYKKMCTDLSFLQTQSSKIC